MFHVVLTELLEKNDSGSSKHTRVFTHLYYFTIAPFYHIRAKERAKYATLLHCRTGQKYGLKASDTKLNFFSGIINPFFDGLTNTTSGHLLIARIFPHPWPLGLGKHYATRKISARIIC